MVHGVGVCMEERVLLTTDHVHMVAMLCYARLHISTHVLIRELLIVVHFILGYWPVLVEAGHD